MWPFQTTQIISGLANFLNNYPIGTAAGIVRQLDHTKLLKQYALLHYNPEREGILDLEEDYYPDTGYPIVGLKRSPHYFHSGFIDLVLSGLVGIRPSADNVLEVNPLIEDSIITYFRAERIMYHGHEIAIQYDVDGSHYTAKGLQIEIDGEIVAFSPTLTKLSVPLTRLSPKAAERRIAQSIQLNSTAAYPRASVSIPGFNSSKLYPAIDGRIWFFPETDVANGWSTPVSNGTEMWLEVDFGNSTSTSGAEIAFFVNEEQGFDVPGNYKVQIAGQDVKGGKYGDIVANGITEVSWDEFTSEKVRLTFAPKLEKKVRVVEFKVY